MPHLVEEWCCDHDGFIFLFLTYVSCQVCRGARAYPWTVALDGQITMSQLVTVTQVRLVKTNYIPNSDRHSWHQWPQSPESLRRQGNNFSLLIVRWLKFVLIGLCSLCITLIFVCSSGNGPMAYSIKLCSVLWLISYGIFSYITVRGYKQIFTTYDFFCQLKNTLRR